MLHVMGIRVARCAEVSPNSPPHLPTWGPTRPPPPPQSCQHPSRGLGSPDFLCSCQRGCCHFRQRRTKMPRALLEPAPTQGPLRALSPAWLFCP